MVIRETIDVPVIGLEPAIKPATLLSKSGIIGVLATQRTINSERLLGLIRAVRKRQKSIGSGMSGFSGTGRGL